MNKQIEKLKERCSSYRRTTFKEKDKSISRALHIPYSGMSDPDYVDFYDYLEDDACSLLSDWINNLDNIEDLDYDELVDEFDSIDDDSTLHQHVESSLTWQQSLRESDIIINNCDYEETDSGLWEGIEDPEEAITSKAFWTYKEEVANTARAILKEFEE